jgi:hypothetical protein
MASSSKDVVVDTADKTPRHLSAKGQRRVRAITFASGTTVIIRKQDFALGGVDHEEVVWDFRVDDFTVAVGEGISAEAADYLTSNFPDSFVYVDE